MVFIHSLLNQQDNICVVSQELPSIILQNTVVEPVNDNGKYTVTGQ